MELAAALDLSHEATLALLGDVLDLAHRLPRVWGLVRGLRVPVHLARLAASESRDLSLAAAGPRGPVAGVAAPPVEPTGSRPWCTRRG